MTQDVYMGRRLVDAVASALAGLFAGAGGSRKVTVPEVSEQPPEA